MYIKAASGPGPFGTGSLNVGSLCETSQGTEKGRVCPHHQNIFVSHLHVCCIERNTAQINLDFSLPEEKHTHEKQFKNQKTKALQRTIVP